MNAWDEVRAAVRTGTEMQNAVDGNAGAMGRLLMNRLRASEMPHCVLEAFKRELREYNIHTSRWRR